MNNLSVRGVSMVILLACVVPGANATLLGPTPYLEFADSPFQGGSFGYFHLEDFEDGVFDVPGVTASTGFVTSTGFSGSIIDSVDGDDGDPTNGSCLGCDSYFASPGSAGITFTFDASVLGSLPTSAGLVWTDGAGTIEFEAFDANGISLGMLSGSHADGSFLGTTAEDRFYGVTDLGGISALFIRNTSGGIEIDHLQYGGAAGGGGNGGTADEPAIWVLLLAGLGALGVRRRRS